MKYTIKKSEIFGIANARKAQKLLFEKTYFDETGVKPRKCYATDETIARLRIVSGEASEQIIDIETLASWAKLQPKDVTFFELDDDATHIALSSENARFSMVKHIDTLPFYARHANDLKGLVCAELIGDPIILEVISGSGELTLSGTCELDLAALKKETSLNEQALARGRLVAKCRMLEEEPRKEHECETAKYIQAESDMSTMTYAEALEEAKKTLANRRFARKTLLNCTVTPAWLSDAQKKEFWGLIGEYYAAKKHFTTYRPKKGSKVAESEVANRQRDLDWACWRLRTKLVPALAEKFGRVEGNLRSPSDAADGRNSNKSWQKARLVVRSWPAKKAELDAKCIEAITRTEKALAKV